MYKYCYLNDIESLQLYKEYKEALEDEIDHIFKFDDFSDRTVSLEQRSGDKIINIISDPVKVVMSYTYEEEYDSWEDYKENFLENNDEIYIDFVDIDDDNNIYLSPIGQVKWNEEANLIEFDQHFYKFIDDTLFVLITKFNADMSRSAVNEFYIFTNIDYESSIKDLSVAKFNSCI